VKPSSLPFLRAFTNARFRELVAAVLAAGGAARLGLSLVGAFANMTDFRLVFVPTARLAWQGINPYHHIPVAASGTFAGPMAGSVVTPTFLFLMWPWTWLPDATGRLVWMAGELACLVAILVMVARGLGGMTRAQLMMGAALMMVFVPVSDSFNEGQVSILLGTLAVAAVFALQRGHPRVAGVCLGLGVAIKLTPALLLPYFAWRRQWSSLLAATLTSLAAVGATMAVGWGSYWLPFVRAIGEVGQGTANLLNQSLNGAILRGVDARLNGIPIGPPPPSARVLIGMASLLVVGGLAAHLAAGRLPPRAQPWSDISILLLGLPLVQPFAWPHHFAQAVVACPVAVALVARGWLPRWVGAVLAACYLAVLFLSYDLFRAASAVNPDQLQANPALLLGGSLLALATVVGCAAWTFARPPAGGPAGAQGRASKI
jgi:hypothetical protein